MPILDKVVYIGSTLVDMYVKCGSLENALRVFGSLQEKDVVTWNVVIAGCAQQLLAQEALQFFQQMLEVNLKPDQVTLISALKACSSIKSLDQGRLIHAHSVDSGYELGLPVGNSIIDMYVKCGSFDAAFNVFERLPKRDVVTWGAVIAECAQDEQGHMALQLFPQMQREGIVPDHATFLCVLKACSSAAAFYQGKQIHAQYIESGLDLNSDPSIGNTLIDMYSKCGSLEDACNVFSRLPKRDLVSWNAVIGGCAQYSNCNLALKYYEDLQQEGYKPDDITFISLLCACNYLGLVTAACHQFNSMRLDYGISPTLEHYNCIVDLLGHAGHLESAEDFLLSTPVGSDAVGWVSLLSQCRIYGHVALAQRCFDHLVSIKGRNAAGFLLMSHVHSHVGGQWNADEVEELRNSSNVWKKPGIAFIAIDYEVHEFNVGGKSHLQINDIYAKSKRLSVQMEEEGYLPLMDLVMHSVSKEDKESIFDCCEELAATFKVS